MDETWPQPYTSEHAEVWIAGQESQGEPRTSLAIVSSSDDSVVLGGAQRAKGERDSGDAARKKDRALSSWCSKRAPAGV